MIRESSENILKKDDELIRKLEQAISAFRQSAGEGRTIGVGEIESLLQDANTALAAMREQIAEIQKIAQIGRWVWEIQNEQVHWSEELERIFNVDHDEEVASYQSFIEGFHPEDRGKIIAQLDKAYKEKKAFEFTGRILRPDRTERILLGRGEVICNSEGEPVRMVGTLQDISDRAQARESLRTMDKLLHVAVYGAPVILFLIDADGLIRMSVGKSLSHLRSESSSAGRSVYEVYVDTPQIIHNYERALAGESFADVVKVDGTAFETHYEPYRDEDGEITGVVGVGLDVTERLQAELTLRESEERQRLLLNSIKDYAIFTLDKEGIITSWNSGAKSIKGYTSDEVIGQHFSIFYPEDERERGRPGEILKQVRTQGHYEDDGWRVRKDGTRFWASVLITPLLDEEGELRGFSKIVRDITPRKNMEEALRESEARFRTIFEGAAIGIELIDMRGRLLAFNPAICRMFGYEASEVRQDALLGNDHPVNVLAGLRQFKEMQQGAREVFTLDKPFRHKEGHWVWGRLSVGLVRDTEGEPVYIVAMVEDIHERREMEAELAELQRRLMEGRESERLHLAQELHDGPVQELYGLSYSLNAIDAGSPDGDEDQPVKEAQETVQGVIQRLRTISSELRPPTLAPFGLEKAIRSHAQQFQEDHPELNIQLDLKADRQTLPEQARLALFRIYQASLTNVLRHAEATQVIVRFTFDAEQIELEIEDDGRGFSLPARWITLARQGHLGLVGARERAESLGGKFEVRSEPGEGTCVCVTVPFAELRSTVLYE